MSGRQWYPQLDVYDSVRRIGVLLDRYEDAPGIERLYIVDFFLANPPLLHRTQMTRETRTAFSELEILRPEKTFLNYPATPLLFHKMEPIQKGAISALSGKGLMSIRQLKRGIGQLTKRGEGLFAGKKMSTETESALVDFLVQNIGAQEDVGNIELRRRTGVRRPV